jgi:hypothetical protein
MSGGLAALQLGPVARNLSGARMASSRIVEALLKPSLSFSSAHTTAQSLEQVATVGSISD